MSDSPDYIQEFMKERPGVSASERHYRNKSRSPVVLSWIVQKKRLIFVVAGIVSVAALVFFLGDDEQPTENIASLKARITKLEVRLTNLEATTRKMIVERKEAAVPYLPRDESSRTAEGYQDERSRFVERRYHEIQPGDSLSLIAEQYDLSLNQLCRLNGISPNDTIYPGQKLLVVPSR